MRLPIWLLKVLKNPGPGPLDVRLSVLLAMGLVIFWGAVIILVVAALENPACKRFGRYCAYKTQEEFMAAESNVVEKVETVEVNGARYTLVNVGWLGFLPSGAAYLVYDAEGKLVDHTRDEGEDSRFQRKWSHHNWTSIHPVPTSP